MKEGLRLFHELLRHMPDAIYFKDRNSCFLAASEFTAQLLGCESADDLIGKSDFDFFSADQAEVMFQDEQRVMATGQAMLWKDEHEYLSDGREKWFSTTKVPLHDEAGAVVGILGISRDETERMRAELRMQRQERELREHLSRMEAEVERARVVQELLLPAAPPQIPGLEIVCVNQPMEAVGGDYWAFPVLADGRNGIFVGDLTGHGVSAALYMTLVRFVSEQLWSVCGDQPVEVLASLNAALTKQMPGCFLTALYALIHQIDNDGAELELAAGGHTEPIIVRGDGAIEFVELKASGALALFESFSAESAKIRLAPGDSLLLYTDGLTEVWDDAGELFGEAGLAAIAAEVAGQPPAVIADRLVEAAAKWRQRATPDDDTLLIVIQAQ